MGFSELATTNSGTPPIRRNTRLKAAISSTTKITRVITNPVRPGTLTARRRTDTLLTSAPSCRQRGKVIILDDQDELHTLVCNHLVTQHVDQGNSTNIRNRIT